MVLIIQISYLILLSGEWVACSVGANFTPHFITVNPGEVSVEISIAYAVLLLCNAKNVSDIHGQKTTKIIVDGTII